MRRSHIAVGDVVRLSSRGSLRRRRGLVVVLEQGVEVALVDMHTQTPVHTYTIAPSDRVCTPPLVVERSMPTSKQLVRTTYWGVLQADHTQVRAFTESLDSRGKPMPGAEAQAPITWDVPGALTGLYALGDVVPGLKQMSVAVGHAAQGATAVHNSLEANPWGGSRQAADQPGAATAQNDNESLPDQP